MALRKGTKTCQGKQCKRCKGTLRYATSQRCVQCDADHVRARQYRWREKTQHRYRRYGITRDHFDALLLLQQNKCVGCFTALDGGPTTHIDHDHKTNRVRGLLCPNCNRALGMMKDNVEILLRLGVYLEQSRGPRQ